MSLNKTYRINILSLILNFILLFLTILFPGSKREPLLSSFSTEEVSICKNKQTLLPKNDSRETKQGHGKRPVECSDQSGQSLNTHDKWEMVSSTHH